MELYVTAFCKLGLGKNIQSQNSENTKKLTNIFKNRVRTLDRRTYRIFMVRRWAKKKFKPNINHTKQKVFLFDENFCLME